MRSIFSALSVVTTHATSNAIAFPVTEERSEHESFRYFQIVRIREGVFLLRVIFFCIVQGSSSVP
jgi:hypothetical protein